MGGISYDPVPINESIPGECLAVVNTNEPWFTDYANFLVGRFLPTWVCIVEGSSSMI
jgi:hypothetical protein